MNWWFVIQNQEATNHFGSTSCKPAGMGYLASNVGARLIIIPGQEHGPSPFDESHDSPLQPHQNPQGGLLQPSFGEMKGMLNGDTSIISKLNVRVVFRRLRERMAIYLLRWQILDIKLVDSQMNDASNQDLRSSSNFRAPP